MNKKIFSKGYTLVFSFLLWVVFVLYLLGGIRFGGKLRLTYLHDLWIACGVIYLIGRVFGLVRFRNTSLGRNFLIAVEAIINTVRLRSLSHLKRLGILPWIMIGTFAYSAVLFISLPILYYRAFGMEIFDLGVFINVVHNKATTGRFDTFFMSPNGIDPLAYFPHAKINFFLYVFALIYKILPYTEAFLLLQSLAILLAIIPLYKLGDILLPKAIPRWAPLILFILWDPIYRTNSWDIHEQPFMMGLALWSLYFIETRKIGLAILNMLLMAMWRDDGWWTMSAMALFLGIRTKKWLVAIPLFLFGALVLPIHISFLNRVNTIGQLYPYLGPNLKSAVWTVTHKPWVILETIWTNKEYFIRLILSLGGGFFLFSGWAIIPAVPIVAMIGLSRHDGLLSWLNHYPLGFAGPMFFATLVGWKNVVNWLDKKWPKKNFAAPLIGCSLAICITQLAYNLSGALTLGTQRYRDTRCLEKVLAQIPEKVPLLAESVLAARMSDRYYIMRPSVDVDQTQAQYLAAFDKSTMKAGMKGIFPAKPWEVFYENCGVFVARRK